MDKIILEKTISELRDVNSIDYIVQEAIDKIPFNKKLKNLSVRRKLYENCGSCAFLDPKRLRYPIIDPDDLMAVESKTPDCNLLLKSFYELKLDPLNDSENLSEKVKTIIESSTCNFNKLYVHLEGFEEIIDLDTMLFYFSDSEDFITELEFKLFGIIDDLIAWILEKMWWIGTELLDAFRKFARWSLDISDERREEIITLAKENSDLKSKLNEVESVLAGKGIPTKVIYICVGAFALAGILGYLGGKGIKIYNSKLKRELEVAKKKYIPKEKPPKLIGGKIVGQ